MNDELNDLEQRIAQRLTVENGRTLTAEEVVQRIDADLQLPAVVGTGWVETLTRVRAFVLGKITAKAVSDASRPLNKVDQTTCESTGRT